MDETASDVFTSVKTSQKLSDRIVVQIEDAITTGRFQLGQRLPPERQLAETFGVGRSVVREAARTLEQKGLLETRPGLGIFVTSSVERVLADSLRLLMNLEQYPAVNIFEVRSILEVGIAGFAALRATPQDIAKMEQCVDEMVRQIENPAGYIEADLAFHQALAESTHNDLFVVLFNAMFEALRAFIRQIITDSASIPTGLAEHRDVFEAVRSGQPDDARNMMLRHLNRSVQPLRRMADAE